MATWQLLTGEAPGAGGIGDYTAVLADALRAAGEAAELVVARSPARLEAALAGRTGPLRLVFQYAPQAWGARGMNVAVCRWLAGRRAAGDDVRVTFHEPFYPFGWQRPQRNLLALVNRWMARRLLRASTRAYVSTAAWEPLLRPLAPRGLPIQVLPIPSTIPFSPDPPALARLRAGLSDGGRRPVVAHFGTYGALVGAPLAAALGAIAARRDGVRFLLLGRGGAGYAAHLRAVHPALEVVAPGELPAAEVSLHLQAADVAVQPYPDGVDTRRTTAMACLASGVPLATTRGRLTDPVWEGGPLTLAASARELADDVLRLLAAPPERGEVRRFYARHFAAAHTVRTLLGEG